MEARREPSEVGWQRLAEAIVEVARELRATLPAPREAPFYGLDAASDFDLRVFDALSTRDIFRKYEFALDIASGLGGRARWLALRHGCRVLGVDPRCEVVAAAAALSRRAHLSDRARFQAGLLEALPFRSRVFTHVWMLAADLDGSFPAVLAEAFRVLRNGGHAAVQLRGNGPGARAAAVDCMRVAGFVELDAVDAPLAEAPDAYRLAERRLRRALRGTPAVASLWGSLRCEGGPTPHVQVFGRRPA